MWNEVPGEHCHGVTLRDGRYVECRGIRPRRTGVSVREPEHIKFCRLGLVLYISNEVGKDLVRPLHYKQGTNLRSVGD